MRTAFIKTLEAVADDDPRVNLVVGDLGFGVVTDFAKKFPQQYLNIGVAEQKDPSQFKRLAKQVFKELEIGRSAPVSPRSGFLLSYVLPRSWTIPEIPMRNATTHHTPDGFDNDQLKLVVARAHVSEPMIGDGLDRLRRVQRVEPLLEAWIDGGGKVERIFEPADAPFYGDATVPLF